MNLLDPQTYAGVRRSLLDAETLPPQCYTSREFYEREVSEIFMKCWNVVAREDFVRNPGDYHAFKLVGVPAFIVRGADGKLRAFVNTCRHRGARLLDGAGNVRSIVCPYHAWTYDLDGRLVGPNGMADTRNYSPSDYRLLEILVDTWGGFVFVNFDRTAGTLREYLGDLDEHVESYGLESMVTMRRLDFRVRCNWKNYVENSQEIFHLPIIHRNTFGRLQAEWTHVDGAPGNFTIQGTRLADPRPRSVLDGKTGFDRIPGLKGAAAAGAQYILVYPCTIIGCDLDFMWYRHMEPVGPDEIHYKGAFCFPRQTVERPDFEEIVQNYYKRADAVIAEDNSAATLQFEGLSQPFGRPGRFSSREPLVHAISNWVLDRVFGR